MDQWRQMLKNLMEVDGRNLDKLIPLPDILDPRSAPKVDWLPPLNSSTGDDPGGCLTLLKKPGSSTRQPIEPWWNMWETFGTRWPPCGPWYGRTCRRPRMPTCGSTTEGPNGETSNRALQPGRGPGSGGPRLGSCRAHVV